MTGAHAPSHGHSELHGPRWLSISSVAILGIAAVLAGVTAWKSAVMEGHAVENLTLSTKATTDANALTQTAERSMTSERQLFIDFRSALDSDNKNRSVMIYGMMNPNTRAAIGWWREQPETSRPTSPFVSANPSWDAPGVIIDAKAALDRSDEYLQLAEFQLGRAHSLQFLAALLTIAFLASGLTPLFESLRSRISLISLSTAVVLACLIGTVVFW
ncbi:MAG: hypothetical protein JHD05_04495 [Thermoleophilia bacterium]|jgi:hypothetical protein|nr:hypothetical protein [Thermoleophilia bacterium]MBJ7333865.1 hypothetical protein [Thermoleophilia bacterium]